MILLWITFAIPSWNQGFNTDRVLDNTARDFLFLVSLGDHRATSGQEDFLGPACPPSAQQDVPSQVVMEEERTNSGKRHGHYNAAAVRDVTT